MALIEIDGLPNLIAWWIFSWRTVSHNQRVNRDEFNKNQWHLDYEVYLRATISICNYIHTAHSYFSKCSYMLYIFTIWLWLTVRHGKIHHAVKFGKPSISIRAMALPWQTVSHNQMVNYWWCTATGSCVLTAQSQPEFHQVFSPHVALMFPRLKWTFIKHDIIWVNLITTEPWEWWLVREIIPIWPQDSG